MDLVPSLGTKTFQALCIEIMATDKRTAFSIQTQNPAVMVITTGLAPTPLSQRVSTVNLEIFV